MGESMRTCNICFRDTYDVINCYNSCKDVICLQCFMQLKEKICPFCRITYNKRKLCKLYQDKGIVSFTYDCGEYMGTVDENDKPLVGKMIFNNGNIYDGEWKKGLMHGKGRMTFNNGSVYEGEWEYNLMHGKGVCAYENGDIYEGEFKNSTKYGKGVYTYTDGGVHDGEYVNELKHGKGVYIYPNGGDVLKCEWKDNKRHGNSTLTLKNGTVTEINYVNGKREGPFIIKYNDGSVYEGVFKNNLHCHGELTIKDKKIKFNFRENGCLGFNDVIKYMNQLIS